MLWYSVCCCSMYYESSFKSYRTRILELLWHTRRLGRHVVRTNDEDSIYRFPVPPTLNIFLLALSIHLMRGLKQETCRVLPEIFYIVLKEHLEGVEQAAEVHICGSLYHCDTCTSVLL